MARTRVGMAIDQLLTEDSLRLRFAHDRIDTIAELCQRGIVLTSDEIDVLCQIDSRLWHFAEEVTREVPCRCV